MSYPDPPVFIISGIGVTSGITDIPLYFEPVTGNFEIYWSYDGTSPISGTLWQNGQNIQYNSWVYENTFTSSASVFIQAIVRDITTDEYSAISIQEYNFFCAKPNISLSTSGVDVYCSSPESLIYYFPGSLSAFDYNSSSTIQISNPAHVSLPNGEYVFFSTTRDGLITNLSFEEIVVDYHLDSILNHSLFLKEQLGRMYVELRPITLDSICVYTLNGEEPNLTSTVYTSAFLVTAGTIIKTKSFLSLRSSSTNTYMIKSIPEYFCNTFLSNGSLRRVGLEPFKIIAKIGLIKCDPI